MDCEAIERVLHRAVVDEVPDEELEQALEHIAGCPACRARFEVLLGDAFPERKKDLPEVADVRAELFERALTAALSDDDPVVRERASERLGGFERLGAAALAELARTASEDSEREVRAAALAALDRLDEAVALSQRLIEAWSASPTEAAPYLADALARLAGARGVELASGGVAAEEAELRLTLEGLPPALEGTKPLVALPGALAEDAPPVEWRGDAPGLVSPETPVAGGRLEVFLGNLLEPEVRRRELEKQPPASLFGQVYLLTRERV